MPSIYRTVGFSAIGYRIYSWIIIAVIAVIAGCYKTLTCLRRTEMVAETKILLSVEEAMRALSLGRTKLLELAYAGVIPTTKVGRRRLIPLQGLVEWSKLFDQSV